MQQTVMIMMVVVVLMDLKKVEGYIYIYIYVARLEEQKNKTKHKMEDVTFFSPCFVNIIFWWEGIVDHNLSKKDVKKY